MRTRSQRRAMRGETINVYPAVTALGWRVIQQIAFAEGMHKVALGHARLVRYEDGAMAGIQILNSFRTDDELPSHERPGAAATTITVAEMQLNAGTQFEEGRSRTAGMPEWKRVSRHGRYDDRRILEPEDRIERAIAKVRVWPHPASRVDDGRGKPVYGDRAVRVYPKG